MKARRRPGFPGTARGDVDFEARLKKDPPGIASGRVLVPERRRRLLRLLASIARFERRAQNVAERSAGVGRAVFRDRLLLLGDFERLDGDGDLARLAVELDHASVDLLADREALGPLVAAI